MSKNGYQVLEYGSGVPMVMLHGMMGAPENWKPLWPHLPRGCRALALRFPFFREGEDLLDVDAVVEYLAGFLDSRGLSRVVLCGNSLGGHVSLDLAARAPDRVIGMVLTGSGGLFERSFARVSTHPPREWVRDRIREIFYDGSHVTEGLVDDILRIIADRRNARELLSIAKSAKRDNVSDRLPSVKCPVLLVWGRQDTITPPDVAEELLRGLRRREIVWLDRCGHAPMIEKPELFGEALRRWWQEHVAPDEATEGRAP
jgi:pimeloyl-ACP methyl ester carboxylesterase